MTVKDGTCYVNLDNGFLTQTYNVSAEVQIYSIVNSLVELSNINKVQIAVNGNTDMIFREKISLSNVFDRTLIWFTKRRNYNHKNCRRPLCAAILIFLTLYLAARLLPEWVGTDAGTDTSEKAPIGGRTSLTQPDTWLGVMDGETLCLTGKVTDCWQPVDNPGKRQLSFKDLSIEADASSFYFSGIRRKRPITCHRYPVRQMRTRCQFLFLLRKQPHKSMKCRKYSGKTRVRCAICRKTKRCQEQAAMFGFSVKCRHFCRQRILENSTQQPIIGEKTACLR